MAGEQHIHGFALSIQDELQSFRENWEENHQSDPEQWPMEMSQSDWLEQFIVWLEMDDEEKV